MRTNLKGIQTPQTLLYDKFLRGEGGSEEVIPRVRRGDRRYSCPKKCHDIVGDGPDGSIVNEVGGID